MSNIQTRCTWILNNIVDSINHYPRSAILALGNLLCLKPDDKDDATQIVNTFNTLSQMLTPEQINALWNASQGTAIEESTQRGITKFKQMMLSTPSYFNHLENTAIVAQGQNLECYRFSLIALIRKAMLMTSIDHFADFDFSLLNQIDASQDAGCVQAIIAKCHNLPIADIIALGERAEIARLILLDLATHDRIFEVEAAFARQHPALRADIATRWQSHFQQFPMTSEQTHFVEQALGSLRIYPEFSNIRVNSRLPRVFERLSGVTSIFSSFADYFQQFVTSVIDLNDAAATDCFEFVSETSRTLLPSNPLLNRVRLIKSDEPQDALSLRLNR